MYKVDLPTKERWIYIFEDYSTDEPDYFMRLVKAYQHELAGKIIKITDNTQYKIDNDPLELVFQWDSCFGNTVIVPRKSNLNEAYILLIKLCEKLNSE